MEKSTYSSSVRVTTYTIYDSQTEAKLTVAKNLFAKHDVKGTGQLEPQQVVELISATYAEIGIQGYVPSVEDVKQFMEVADTDKNGLLSFQEYEKFVLNCLEKSGLPIQVEKTINRTNRYFNPSIEIQLDVARRLFAKFDTDLSGFLEDKEIYKLIIETYKIIGMENYRPTEDDVKYYLLLADQNKDGKISIQEFEDLILSSLKKAGLLVIQYKKIGQPEECEEEKPKRSAATHSQYRTKNVYDQQVEAKLTIARKLFIQHDAYKKGSLSYKEVAGLVKSTFSNAKVKGYVPTVDDVKVYMIQIHAEKEGFVQFEEYEEYVIYCLKKAGVSCEVKSTLQKSRRRFNPQIELQLDVARKIFGQFDTDKSGYLEENEIYGLIAFTHKELGFIKKPTAEDVKQYITMADKNQDGVISISEFEDLILESYKRAGLTIVEYEQVANAPQRLPEKQSDVNVSQNINQSTSTSVRREGNTSYHETVTVTKVTKITTTTKNSSGGSEKITITKMQGEPITERKVVSNSSATESISNSQNQLNTSQNVQIKQVVSEIKSVNPQQSHEEEKQKKDKKSDSDSDSEQKVKRNKKNKSKDSSDSDSDNEHKKSDKQQIQKKESIKQTQIISKNIYTTEIEEKLTIARKLFIQHDLNRNGQLDMLEVAGLISSTYKEIGITGHDPTAEDVIEYMKTVDTNQNGQISYEEYETYVITCLKKTGMICDIRSTMRKSDRKYNPETEIQLDIARKNFAEYDAKKAGYVQNDQMYFLISQTYHEMGIQNVMPSPEDVRYYIELADTDRDGKISIIEFEDLILMSLKQSGVLVIQYKPGEQAQQQQQSKRVPAGKPVCQPVEQEEKKPEPASKPVVQPQEECQKSKPVEQPQEQIKIEPVMKPVEQPHEQIKIEPVSKHVDQPVEQMGSSQHITSSQQMSSSSQQMNSSSQQMTSSSQQMTSSSQQMTSSSQRTGKSQVVVTITKTTQIIEVSNSGSRVVSEKQQVFEQEKQNKLPPQVVVKKVYSPEIEEKLQTARKLFIESDKDKSGQLDQSEVVVLIIKTFESSGIKGYQPTEADVKQYMELIDTDKNGLISYEEYEQYVISCFERAGLECEVKETILKSARKFNPEVELKLDVARRLFAKYDTDKSGELEENEVYGIISDTYRSIGFNDFKPTVDDVRLWIEIADTDKNGSVSIFEYENLILNSLEKSGIQISRFTKV